MKTEQKAENRKQKAARPEEALTAETGEQRKGDTSPALLTKEDLALSLKVGLRTVERMLAEGEISAVRLRRRGLVRFYLPDVVRQLVATALTRKRGPGKERLSDEGRVSSVEGGKNNTSPNPLRPSRTGNQAEMRLRR
jgi:excisionase family DNA binding protein